MMTKRVNQKDSSEKTVRDIRRVTRASVARAKMIILLGWFITRLLCWFVYRWKQNGLSGLN